MWHTTAQRLLPRSPTPHPPARCPPSHLQHVHRRHPGAHKGHAVLWRVLLVEPAAGGQPGRRAVGHAGGRVRRSGLLQLPACCPVCTLLLRTPSPHPHTTLLPLRGLPLTCPRCWTGLDPCRHRRGRSPWHLGSPHTGTAAQQWGTGLGVAGRRAGRGQNQRGGAGRWMHGRARWRPRECCRARYR